MKKLIHNIIRTTGFDIVRYKKDPLPASSERPVGKIDFFLHDVKARGLKCKSLLDVGANNGEWSRLAKKIFTDAVFYLIEPQTEMKDQLEIFIREFPGSKYFSVGVGSKLESKVFTVWDDLAGSSFLPPKNDELLLAGRQREIQLVTIDSLVEQNCIQKPEIVKLDIQGYEIEALKGAESIFGYTELFVIEVSLFPFKDVPGTPLVYDVIRFMAERDYVVYDIAGFARRPLDGALGQCDLCFVKNNSFLRVSNEWN